MNIPVAKFTPRFFPFLFLCVSLELFMLYLTFPQERWTEKVGA